MNPNIPSNHRDIVRNRLRRRNGSFEDRGRNGGGWESFRGGYAKCIVVFFLSKFVENVEATKSNVG